MLTEQSLELTVGPLLFHWPAETIADFYARLADEAPVDHVVVGEVVCSKRLPFYADIIPAAVQRLQRAGKRVSLTSLALPTLARERASARALFASGLDVELNDLSAMGVAGDNGFSVGPLINVYNEATLEFLARRRARSVCLPPELPYDSVKILAEAGSSLGVDIELWAYGRAPLAISARCYHARVHGLSKDFVPVRLRQRRGRARRAHDRRPGFSRRQRRPDPVARFRQPDRRSGGDQGGRGGSRCACRLTRATSCRWRGPFAQRSTASSMLARHWPARARLLHTRCSRTATCSVRTAPSPWRSADARGAVQRLGPSNPALAQKQVC